MVGSWIGPHQDMSDEDKSSRKIQMTNMAKAAISWTTPEEWVIELDSPIKMSAPHMTEEEREFWPTYQWWNNPWITDADGRTLDPDKYSRIQQCSVEELKIQRTGVQTFTMVIPMTKDKMHSQAKLRRWGIAILMSASHVKIGDTIEVNNTLTMRNEGELGLSTEYRWTVAGRGRVQGTPRQPSEYEGTGVTLYQQADGIHWTVEASEERVHDLQEDLLKMRRSQKENGIVFQAHPLIHGFPWTVADTVKNRNVIKAIKKQPFRRYRKVGKGITNLIEKLIQKAEDNEWQAAVLQQTPADLWTHNNELTEYQVWVAYRVATRQLNLFHDGWQDDRSCRKTTDCHGTQETLEHIVWECPAAQKCWKMLIQHWARGEVEFDKMSKWVQHCASRKAPDVTADTMELLSHLDPDEPEEMTTMWTRIWHISSSVCLTSLWIQRNRIIFEGAEISPEQAAQETWTSCLRQLRALANRERRQAYTRSRGTRLLLGLQLFQTKPRGDPSKVDYWAHSQGQPGLVLVNRLQTYQSSCSK